MGKSRLQRSNNGDYTAVILDILEGMLNEEESDLAIYLHQILCISSRDFR